MCYTIKTDVVIAWFHGLTCHVHDPSLVNRVVGSLVETVGRVGRECHEEGVYFLRLPFSKTLVQPAVSLSRI